MIWLIPYILYAVAIFAAISGFGYVIVVYFAVIQRVLALTLDRILARLTSTADERFRTYRVKHNSKGFSVTSLSLPPELLKATQASGIWLTALSIQTFDVELPSFNRPLRCRVVGMQAAMQLLQMPVHVPMEKRESESFTAAQKDKSQRLEIIEELLWGWGRSKHHSVTWQWINAAGAMQYIGRLQAKILQKSLAIITQYVQFEVSGLQVHYFQQGEPGPRPSFNFLRGADAAVLRVRKISLTPDSFQTNNGSNLSSMPGESRSSLDQGNRSSHDWRQTEKVLPGSETSQKLVPKSSSTKLSLSGVSLVLQTYPSLWQQHTTVAGNKSKQPQQGSSLPGNDVMDSDFHPDANSIIDLNQALLGIDVEDHIVFSQWEASLRLSIVPPIANKAFLEQQQGMEGIDTLINDDGEIPDPSADAALFQGSQDRVVNPPSTPASHERPSSANTIGQGNGKDVFTRSLTLRDSLLGGSDDFSMLENVLSGGIEGYDEEQSEFSGMNSPHATNGQNVGTKIATSSPPRPFSIQEDTIEEISTHGGVTQDERSGNQDQIPVPNPDDDDRGSADRVESSEDDLVKNDSDTIELVVDININLKALIAELNAESVGILSRLVDRHLRFSRYGEYWATRPLVPVIGNESKWWQHAGKTLGRYSRSVARRQPSLSLMADRRQARLEYQALYAQAHSSHHYYCDPGKKWWQLFIDRTAQKLRLKKQEDKKKTLQRLKELEKQLDVEQLAHFRFGAATKHNRIIANDPQLARFIIDKIDALVYSRRTEPLGNGAADLLLHRDRPLPPSIPVTPGEVSLVAFRLHLAMMCPKLGIALSLKPSKDSEGGELPTHFTSSADVVASSLDGAGAGSIGHRKSKYAVISIKGVSLELDSEEGLALTVQTLEIGHTLVPTAPIEPRILACPSKVCSRVCRAAEFFRYAVTGSVLSESSAIPSDSSNDGNVMCARVVLLPRHGVGGATVDGVSWDEDIPSGDANRNDINYAKQNWCPAGFDVTIQMAAVGIVYDGNVVSSLLSLAAACETCTLEPWAWADPGFNAEAGPSSLATPPSWPPPLPHRPVFVEEMVETAFSAANIPMLGHFSLPSNTLEVRCPGIALQLPYKHKTSAGIFKGSSSTRKLEQDSRVGDGGSKSTDAETHAAAHAVTSSVSSPSSSQPQLSLDDRQQSSAQLSGGPHARKSSIIHADTYRPTSAMARGEISWPMGHEDQGHDGSIIYMFTVAVQNIVVRVTGEEFSMALHGGTARRVETDCYLDIFSYLSMASRKEIARQIMPTRVMFDPTRRQFTEEVAGVEALEEELREIELMSMAKVWGYPEDMPTIVRSIRSRQAANPATNDAAPPLLQRRPSRSLGGLDAASGLAQSMPGLLEDPNQYPLPLIPYFKAAGMRASIAQRLSASPDEPGGSVLACASSIVGVQAWVSPIHVWHLVSLEATVRRMLAFMLGSTLVEKLTAGKKLETKQAGTKSVGSSPPLSDPKEVPAPRPNRRILFTAQIEELSLLWLIGTWTSKASVGNAADQVRYSRAWGITVKRSDPAFLWAQWLAPVYGVSLARVQAAVRRYRSGTVVANASIEGIIVRDLQLPDVAKHAYVLRPLPARARRLNAWIQNMRRTVLGVTSMSLSQFLWKRAFRKIQLRRQTRLSRTNALLRKPLDGRTSPSGSSLLGPQLMVWYRSVPPSPKHPLPQAEIKAEVGQLLAYVRIKQQASMTAFVTQLTQITQLITSEGNGGKGEAMMPYGELRRTVSPVDSATKAKMNESNKAGPRLQSPLRVDIVVVGIDVLFRVQSRDLMSLKMQQGRVTLDKKAVTRHSGPGDIRLHLSATVQDVMVQDMQADPEHALVLIPNSDAGYCSFDAIYTAQVDPRRYAPCLILEMQNPRVLLLFRFIADVLKATDIISDALVRTKAAGMRATSPKGAPKSEETVSNATTKAKPTQETAEYEQREEGKAKPLDVVVQLQNVGIVVPTARTTRTVLAAHLDHLMLAVPGSALPSQLLQDADLPSVDGMLQESLLCNTTFKFGGFHDPVFGGAANPSTSSRPHPSSGSSNRMSTSESRKDGEPARPVEAQGQVAPMGNRAVPSGRNVKFAPAKPSDEDSRKQTGDKAKERRPGAATMLRNLLSSTSAGTSTGHHQAGVLFLDDSQNYEPEREPAGVLHVPAAHRMEQRPQTKQKDDGLVDNVLAVPVSVAKHVAGATKRFVGEMVEAVEGDSGHGGGLDAHTKNVVVMDEPPRGKQDVGTFGKGAVDGASGATPEVALPADRDADDTTKLRWLKNSPVQPELPRPLLALCIEDFRIVTGALVRIPDYYQKATGRKSDGRTPTMRPQGSFIPPSLSAFSWPSQVFDVVPSSTLVQPANVSMTQFLRTRAVSIRPDAKPTPQLHLSSTPLTAMLSTPNFVTIMDFVNGNLNDLLHPPGDVPKPGQGGAAVPKQVKYNPNLKFGPDPRATINFRFTLAIPSIAAVFLANPNEWMKAKPVYSYANAANSHLLQPFFHASVSNLLMDLGTLEGGNTHINFCATSLDLLDLRMGQRLAHVSSKVSQEEEEEEVVASGEGHTQWFHNNNNNTNENENDTPQPSSSRQTFGQEGRDSDAGHLSNMSPLRVSDAATTLSTPATPAFAFLNEPGFTVDSSRAASDRSYTPGNPEWYSNGSHSQQRMARNITVDSTAVEPPHTGIRLSVARRLSEHSHRRAASGEDMQQFNSPLESLGPGSHGAPTPGRNAGGVPRKYLPVLDFVDLPEVSNQCLEPGEQHEGPVVGRDMATFRILTAPHHPPLEEVPRGAAKTTTSGVKSYPGSNPNVRVEVSVAVLSDGTTAVEIALSSALIQWPYFHDASLIMSLINLFKVPSIEEREENGDDYPVPQQEQQQNEKQQQGTKVVPPGGMATSIGSLAASDTGPSSWLYVNALLVDTELFVPIIDVPMAQRLIDELWEREEVNGVDASMEGNTREQSPAPDHPAKTKKTKRIPTKSHFQKVADLALATMLLDSTDNPGALALEERGLAVGITIGRVAYAAGGDGESVLKVDVKDMAAFIRDPNALMHCILQPFSCSMELMSQVPEAAEHLEVERMHRAATIIQRQWRRLMARKLLKDHKAQAEAALAFQGLQKSPFKNKKGKQGAHAGPEFEDVNRSRHWLLVDELVMDVASPHTRTLLEDYKKTSRDRMQLMYLSQYRAVSGMTIRIEAGEVTMRAAFSHVSFWQTAIQGVEEVVVSALQADGILPARQHSEDGGPSNSASASASASSSTSSLALKNHGLASSASTSVPALGFGSSSGSGSIAAKAAAAAFRPHSFHLSGALENLALVLCNDKPETFGAPDVLQFSVCKATASYDAATILPDRPANKAGRLELSTHASFLNSGTSKWEPLFDLWPVMAEFVDINSPIFISDRKTNLWITSERHLNVTFNPASLMSVGDALAFFRAFDPVTYHSVFSKEEGGDKVAAEEASMMTGPSVAIPRSLSERRPSLAMSQSSSALVGGGLGAGGTITSRAPQKYLIQNQSGIRLYYWVDANTTYGGGGVGSSMGRGRSPVYALENGVSETLRVIPTTKCITFHQLSAATGAERLGSVVNLHFEGNWMPLRDVAINLVGKYRYLMVSPADNTSVPVVVDIILVGRTKIITVHSAIWVENSIGLAIRLRLHVPTTPLVPPPAAITGHGPAAAPLSPSTIGEGDVTVGPLAPRAGCYLPLTAALGGLLFLQPEGYQEASRDVIRLTPDVVDLLQQQGYVSCEPLDSLGPREGPLHVSVDVIPSRPASEFQAFKHMECTVPGTLHKAKTPLQVTLSIRPTMVICNALPYEMRVLLWQVAPPEAPSTPTTASAGSGDVEGSSQGKRREGRRIIKRKEKEKEVRPPNRGAAAFLEMLSPRTSVAVPPPARRSSGTFGRYFCHSVPAGATQDVHVDMRQNVLIHVSVEEINMRTTKWSLCSWAVRGDRRGERYDAPRLPKDVQLRMVSVGMPLPTHEVLVPAYLARLKEAGVHVGTLHKQFHRDARIAATPADLEKAVSHIKSFARRMGKAPRKMRSVLSKTAGLGKGQARGLGQSQGPSDEDVDEEINEPEPEPQLQPQSQSQGQRQTVPAVAVGTDDEESESLRRVEVVRLSTPSPGNETLLQPIPNPKPRPRPPPLEIASTPVRGRGRSMLRTPFDVWDSQRVGPSGGGRSGRSMPPTPPTPGRPQQGGARDDEDEGEDAELRAPSVLHVGVHNTLVEKTREQAGVCRMTFYVPFWLNNRTGVNLFYRDRTSAPPYALLLGASIPGDYGEVFVPGTSMTEVLTPEVQYPLEEAQPPPCGFAPPAWGATGQAVLEYKLVLMNKQEDISLGLGHVRRRQYSVAVPIKTVGNKGTVELRGPPANAIDNTSCSAPKQASVHEQPDFAKSTARAMTTMAGNIKNAAAVPVAAVTQVGGALASPLANLGSRNRGRRDEGNEDSNTSTYDTDNRHQDASREGQGLSHDQVLQGTLRGLSRHSVGAHRVADVLSTHPGTMLVRITSGSVNTMSPSTFSSRPRSSQSQLQPWSSPAPALPLLAETHETGKREDDERQVGEVKGEGDGEVVDAATEDVDVDAAFKAMQQVPVPSGSLMTLEDAVQGIEQQQQQQQGEGTTLLQTDQQRSEQQERLKQKQKQEQKQVQVQVQQAQNAEPLVESAIPSIDLGNEETRRRFMQGSIEGSIDGAPIRVYAQEPGSPEKGGKHKKRGQRLFEFAVDVAAGPPDSMYRHTKLVTLKPKYIIENQTGIPLDVKQLNAPDPLDASNTSVAPPSCRFARLLEPGHRTAVYWDDADLTKELVVRPRPHNEPPDAWNWSGGFPIPDTEWYFGLRVRRNIGVRGIDGRQEYQRECLNIPVNVTVGSSGSVQVTLKSPASVPPYRIENACKEVLLHFVQAPLVFRQHGKMYVDSLNPGETAPYAWDEPTLMNKLRVQARVVGRSTEARVGDYMLDRLGDAPMLLLPTHQPGGEGHATSRRLYRTLSNDLPEDLKKRLASLLAAEFSKKVYVTVYADGPTRVLRFSDDKNISSLEQQHIVLDLAARLKQVEAQLRGVNTQFVRLSGMAGTSGWTLDLYGRMPPRDRPKDPQTSVLARKKSVNKKFALPEATQTLVEYASRRTATGQQTGQPEQSGILESKGGTSKGKQAVGPQELMSLERQPTVRFTSQLTDIEKEKEKQLEEEAASMLPLSARRLRRADSRDWGHITIDTSLSGAGTRSMVTRSPSSIGPSPSASASPSPLGSAVVHRPFPSDAGPVVHSPGASPGVFRVNTGTSTHPRNTDAAGVANASGHGGVSEQQLAATLTTVASQLAPTSTSVLTTAARRQELLRLMAEGDAVLLIGGDLTVTVVQAKDLAGMSRSTHAFARVRVRDPVPMPVLTASSTTDGGTGSEEPEDRARQTSVVWQSTDPVWDEALVFREVCAASELVVELWDLGGTRSSKQLNSLANNTEVIKSCRFLGQAEVPLGETLDAPPGTPLWFSLMRRTSGDVVSGQLQLRFQWDVTARGLLSIKLAALERVLAARREILSALQPVPVGLAASWRYPPQGQVPPKGERGEKATGKDGRKEAQEHHASIDVYSLGFLAGPEFSLASRAHGHGRVAAEVLTRHSQDHTHRHLVVTVLEARGLAPRRGVVVALSANELPNPVVTVSLNGYGAYVTPRRSHTLTPRWPANQRHVFRNADPATAVISVRLGDQRGRSFLRRREVSLGKGVLHAGNVRGDNPVYIWVPLTPSQYHHHTNLHAMDSTTSSSAGAAAGESGVVNTTSGVTEPLAVFLRVQWQTEAARGSSMKLEVDAAGAGLMVVGGLQDELFNVTVDSLKASAIRTRLELTVEGTVAKAQLDNQMLDAVEPVVLAPDAGVRPVPVGAAQGPMINFGFVRSFAGSGGSEGGKDFAASETAGRMVVLERPGQGDGGNATTLSSKDKEKGKLKEKDRPGDSRGIRSFKSIRLTVAPLDLMTDESFLEAVLSFFNSLPTADVWQDWAWQEQQRRLLAAQFGPREVDSLAVNAVVYSGAGNMNPQQQSFSFPTANNHNANGSSQAVPNASGIQAITSIVNDSALSWVLEKEAKDLEALHGQSDLSSWFFIESAEIGVISVNVTVSLTSRLLTAGQRNADAGGGMNMQYTSTSSTSTSTTPTSATSTVLRGGAFNRVLGASGFQLVNVSNVAITLGRWVVGNDPSIRGRFSNGFLSQRALASNLRRHYVREGLKEAHKVLGGAGPAVASVPLTVLWASGSALVLLREVTLGNTGPVGAMQQVVYVPVMGFSMFISGFSRMFAALMAAIPPYREDGDDDTIRRIIRRPNNSLDALAAAPKEIGVGMRKAAEGIVLDPVAGWHEYHVAGMVLGLAKATVGVPVRPLIGGLEMTSKIFAALALSSLGRDGIVGKLRRRVRAPGAYAEDATEAAAYTDEGARAFSEARNYARSLQAAWQRVLPEFFPQLREDTVGDVLNTRDTRVVLITDRHIAYLRARHLPEHSIYKAKWLIPIEEVQNIRGDPESRKITIVHIKRYDLKLLGVWPVQKKKSLRCGSRVVYEKTVLRLTKVQQAVQGGGDGAEEREKGEGFVGPELNELTIMSQPYTRGREVFVGEPSNARTPQSNLRHVAFHGPLVDK